MISGYDNWIIRKKLNNSVKGLLNSFFSIGRDLMGVPKKS